MPIFNKKSSSKPKVRVARLSQCPKLEEELDDYKNIHLNMNGRELKFIDGAWISTNGEKLDDVIKLKNKINALEEENNLNKVKVEILLDVLAEQGSKTIEKIKK